MNNKVVYKSDNIYRKPHQEPVNFPIKGDNNLSLVQEKDIFYEDKIDYICINSSDRDTSKYPKVNNYRINFQDTFRNVTSIEIVSGSVANQNSVQSYPYLIVKIDGLDHLTFSNTNVNKGFALLYLKPTTGAHVQPELGCLQRNVRIFKTPLALLSNLDIQIVRPDGVAFDFGESNGDTTVAYQNSFVFKIVTQERKREDITYRNVY